MGVHLDGRLTLVMGYLYRVMTMQAVWSGLEVWRSIMGENTKLRKIDIRQYHTILIAKKQQQAASRSA